MAHNQKETYTLCHYCSKSAIEVMACAIKQSSKDSGCVWSLVATVKSRWHPLGIFHLQTKHSPKLDKLDLGKGKKVSPVKLEWLFYSYFNFVLCKTYVTLSIFVSVEALISGHLPHWKTTRTFFSFYLPCVNTIMAITACTQYHNCNKN